MAASEFYIKAQATWIEQHDIEIGDEIKVCRTWPSGYLGWNDTWAPEMDALVGKTGTILSVSLSSGIQLKIKGNDFSFCFPFYVLEPVKTLDTDNNEEESDRNQKRSRET